MQEVVSKEVLLSILDLLESLNMSYWVDGGWGIDVLLGKQHREHRDIDIDFDGEFTEVLVRTLEEKGYVITTDWGTCRIELHHPKMGYIDIHPLVIAADGSAKQADPYGGWYEFKREWFTSASFENRMVPCISAEAQKLFHTGYELREVDKIDMQNLDKYLLITE